MRVIIGISVIFLALVAKQTLSENKYPDLTCHKGYDMEEGLEDARVASDYCNNRTRDNKEICFKKCILVWIGVLKRSPKQEEQVMNPASMIAKQFVRYAFKEDKEGQDGAMELAQKIYNSCFETYKQVEGKKCTEMEPLYDCVDKAWHCPK